MCALADASLILTSKVESLSQLRLVSTNNLAVTCQFRHRHRRRLPLIPLSPAQVEYYARLAIVSKVCARIATLIHIHANFHAVVPVNGRLYFAFNNAVQPMHHMPYLCNLLAIFFLVSHTRIRKKMV